MECMVRDTDHATALSTNLVIERNLLPKAAVGETYVPRREKERRWYSGARWIYEALTDSWLVIEELLVRLVLFQCFENANDICDFLLEEVSGPVEAKDQRLSRSLCWRRHGFVG